MQYHLQEKTSAKGKWKTTAIMHDRKLAIQLASDLDEHGNCVRVRSIGHADRMERTEFSSISTRSA